MSAWQYAQLTIRLEGRGGEDSCTILWHGPGQGLGENFSGSGQTVLELMNRAGADGWELAGLEERREGAIALPSDTAGRSTRPMRGCPVLAYRRSAANCV